MAINFDNQENYPPLEGAGGGCQSQIRLLTINPKVISSAKEIAVVERSQNHHFEAPSSSISGHFDFAQCPGVTNE